ncbi:MAG: NAD(P)/FAD-dependent oxidoreductase [Candidatus Diapherotrites archaeon]|nr:NAD(P)/FAD-dependent oxidoreductase [Candidatus Diapherotrites archaeon]
MHDIIVVGAGPAGSSCARQLAKRGIKTLLLERDSFPGEKNVCGGLLTSADLKELRPDARIVQRYLDGFIVHSPLHNKITAKFGKVGASVNRNQLDSWLAELAVSAGAELRVNTTAESIEIGNSGVVVKTTSGEERGDAVVVASGATSHLSRSLFGDIFPKQDMAMCFQIDYKLKEDEGEDAKYFHAYYSKSIGYGLGWLTPKKNVGTLGIGVPIMQGNAVKAIFKNFIGEYEPVLREVIDMDKPVKREAAVVPLSTVPKKVFRERALGIGDSANLVNPFSGDGVYYATLSGRIAADVLSNRDYSEEALSQYQERINAECKEAFDCCYAFQKSTFSDLATTEYMLTHDHESTRTFLRDWIWDKTMTKPTLSEKAGMMAGYAKAKLMSRLTGISV